MKKSPLQLVKDKFGSKDKLVDELLALLKRPAETTKEQFKKLLKAQSNRKLISLLEREKSIQAKFGGREKMLDALVEARMGKARKEDKGYRAHLEALTNGRLFDLARRLKIKK
jgi:hypothetical protein